ECDPVPLERSRACLHHAGARPRPTWPGMAAAIFRAKAACARRHRPQDETAAAVPLLSLPKSRAALRAADRFDRAGEKPDAPDLLSASWSIHRELVPERLDGCQKPVSGSTQMSLAQLYT